jgi:hypothetical protein
LDKNSKNTNSNPDVSEGPSVEMSTTVVLPTLQLPLYSLLLSLKFLLFSADFSIFKPIEFKILVLDTDVFNIDIFNIFF